MCAEMMRLVSSGERLLVGVDAVGVGCESPPAAVVGGWSAPIASNRARSRAISAVFGVEDREAAVSRMTPAAMSRSATILMMTATLDCEFKRYLTIDLINAP
jgi:hypothetical protein